MKVHFLSISLFTNIPSLRFIVDFFINKKYSVAITELYIKKSNNHFANKNIEHNIIAEFDNYASLKTGLKGVFFKKYITIFKVLLSKSNDIIYTNDFQVVFFKLLLNKKSKLIYHQFELIESNYLGKFGKIIYNYILKNANKIDLCVFPEENRANYFISQCDIEKDKVILIPNSCKPVITRTSDEKTCIDFIPANTFKVLHTGVLGVAEHYFDTFLSATKMFNAKDNIAFIFIGRKTNEIDKFIEDNNITNVHFINNIPHQELLKVYSKVDLGLILYKGVNLNIEYCAPNKLYEFLSNGVPVLAHQLKGLQPLFNNKVLGELTDFNSIDLIYSSIQKLKGRENNNNQKLLEYFKNNLDIDLYISKLDEQIEKIFKD
jgi:glycosyltransferase involved in cell wall biosynthesis